MKQTIVATVSLTSQNSKQCNQILILAPVVQLERQATILFYKLFQIHRFNLRFLFT